MAGGDSFSFVLDELGRTISTYCGGTLDYLYAIGVLYGAKKTIDAVIFGLDAVRVYFLRFGSVHKADFVDRFGEWAVVTGATSPLGLAFAHELARRRMKLVLIAKSRHKLQQVVNDIKQQYGGEVIALQADFTYGAMIFREIEEVLQAYEVGILVNNVFIAYDFPKYFSELSVLELWQMMNVNVAGCTMLTHVLLEKMVKRRKGAIINVCPSVHMGGPCPLMTGYSATLAYIDHFTRSVECECSAKGVLVQCLVPVSVSEDEERVSLFSPSPKVYVKNALRTLGVTSYTHGYLPHAIWVRDIPSPQVLVHVCMHMYNNII
jgi:17beta-estradiol 17-dehydrogenase / very-long-chain 3-oxoacyl-CoA reductase